MFCRGVRILFRVFFYLRLFMGFYRLFMFYERDSLLCRGVSVFYVIMAMGMGTLLSLVSFGREGYRVSLSFGFGNVRSHGVPFYSIECQSTSCFVFFRDVFSSRSWTILFLFSLFFVMTGDIGCVGPVWPGRMDHCYSLHSRWRWNPYKLRGRELRLR